jgi:hypothetical protein
VPNEKPVETNDYVKSVSHINFFPIPHSVKQTNDLLTNGGIRYPTQFVPNLMQSQYCKCTNVYCILKKISEAVILDLSSAIYFTIDENGEKQRWISQLSN